MIAVSAHRCPIGAPDEGVHPRPGVSVALATATTPASTSAVATLAVRNRVSRRDRSEFVRELFGAEVSTGSVEAIVSGAGEALALPYQKLLGHVRCAPAVNVDETGWRTAGKRRTLWGAPTERAAVFRIAPDRHEHEAKALLGEKFAARSP